MSIDKNAAQRRILTVRAEVLGSLRRDLQLLSAEVLLGMQRHWRGVFPVSPKQIFLFGW